MKNLFPHFIQEKYLAGEENGSFEAYTMFVDLSGFTRMTEALMKRGNEGAERLSNILNAIFAPMVSLVYRRGGSIPYFAGDAFTAIFPVWRSSIDSVGILATAQEQLLFLSRVSSEFEEVDIKAKIGLSFGKVEWGIVGSDNKSYYYRGSAIDGCADSQKYAEESQIIADSYFKNKLPSFLTVKIVSPDKFYLLDSPNTSQLIERKFFAKDVSADQVEEIDKSGLEKEVVDKFLPEAVQKFNQRGEFRRVISVFISFKGVPNHQSLNNFISVVLDEFNNFSGYFKEVDFGDKGGVLLGFFGAPVSFENNIERALEFVASIQEDLAPIQEKTALQFKIGITSGVAYTGLVGGAERCQYAAVGNRVNIAARLMSKAQWGEVLVDEEIQKSRVFKFRHQGDISYKGLIEVIPTYKLVGRNLERQAGFEGKMVGRDKELEELTKIGKLSFQNQKVSVAYIYGEAGIGKSRLSYELRNNLQKESSVGWHTCQSDQILKKPFNPFIYFLKYFFEQSPENSLRDNLKSFEKRFEWLVNDTEEIDHPKAKGIRREIIRTKSVLGALIGLKIPNSIWETLDARGRYENTLSALTNVFFAEALIRPTVFELEDGHWYDEDSIKFLSNLIIEMRDTPVLFLVTSRYDDDGGKPLVFDSNVLKKKEVNTLEIDLNILNPKALKAFAEAKMGDEISDDLHELLVRTANGNPFYAEQILEYFIESDLVNKIDNAWTIKDKNVKISTSINAVLTARIDRLSTLVKETVKAAAVIGREFEVPVLTEVMKAQEAFILENGNMKHVLNEQIKTAERGQIWQAMNELRYIFKHSLLREAVYDMQLRARLRELHRLIGEAIERVYRENLEERYVDLVFHFEHAGDEEKLVAYLKKAGEFSRRNFLNQQAIIFYDKLLKIEALRGDIIERIKTLLAKGNVLELIGKWNDCESMYQEALDLARQTDHRKLIGKANNSLGYVLMLQGNYEDASMYLEAAAAFFESVSNTKGISKVYGNLGNLYFRQGNYEDAKSHFVRSIELGQTYKHTSSNAQIVANLGLTYMNLGNYDEGIEWQQNQLEICQKAQDKSGMATLYTNMGIVYFEKGDYDSALQCYEQGLDLSEELGNKFLTSIAIGCIGSVYERKGNYDKAMKLFQKDLTLTQELGDKQGISIALGLIGDLHSMRGDFDEAIQFMSENLTISEELGYQKGIAKAVNTLGDVYFFKNDFKTSLKYYDRAIEVTRGIGNKLVLGFSLVEKGGVLVSMGIIKDAQACIDESLEIAQELGNSDLIFEARILRSKIAFLEGKDTEGHTILSDLLKETTDKKELAAVYFELSKNTDIQKYKPKALALYEELYSETPHHLFKLRIKELG